MKITQHPSGISYEVQFTDEELAIVLAAFGGAHLHDAVKLVKAMRQQKPNEPDYIRGGQGG